MKKVVVLSMTILFAASMVMGQATKSAKVPLKKLEGKEISSMAKESFVMAFGNIPNVKWVRSPNFDEATFVQKGKEMKAFFGYDGKFVGTTTHVTFADLPASAQREIKAKYKDYTIDPVVVFFDDNELNESDMVLYGTQFDDADNYFVLLTKGTKKIVLQINTEGTVYFFKELS